MSHPPRMHLLLLVLAGALAFGQPAPEARTLGWVAPGGRGPAALQQATETPTPSLTPTPTATTGAGTLTTTVTVSTTPGTGTPSLTPTVGTPGTATVTPTRTVAVLTATIPFQAAPTATQTPTVTLAPTQPPIEVTLQDTATPTGTLIPLPEITFQYPQRTSTQVLLARQDADDPSAPAKGSGFSGALASFARRIARYAPLLVIGVLWLALGVWFLITQVLIHKK